MTKGRTLRGGILVAGATVLGVAIQALSGGAKLACFSGEAAPSSAGLGPLWTPYCTPSSDALLRAARWPDFGGWIFENAGDLLCVWLAISVFQAWLGPSPVRITRALRLVGGELALSRSHVLALIVAVSSFDLAFLVPPRNVVLWEIARDTGILSSFLLTGYVAWTTLVRRQPADLWRARAEWAVTLASASLCTALLAGAFLSSVWPGGWATAGPRWPMLAFAVSIQGWIVCSRRSPSPAAALRTKMTLALVSFTVMLGIAEVGARVWLLRDPFETNTPGERPSGPSAAGAEVANLENPQGAIELSRLVRASRNPRRVYELRPNQRDTIDIPSLRSTPFRTNAFGMRGPEVEKAKPAGTRRIAGLGDSVMFGWGVPYAETHLAVLGELLQQQDPDHRYETLNFGVPGYNTVMERETFVDLAREFSPDLVLLTVVKNDADLPNFLQRPRNPLCLHRAFFSGLLHRLTVGSDPYVDHEILVAQSYDFREGQFKREDARTPMGSEELSGTDNAVAALRRLNEDVRSAGAQLVITFDHGDLDEAASSRKPDVRDAIAEAAAELGILSIDPRPRLVEFLRENELRSEDLWVGAHDSHPNPTRHRLTAEVLSEQLAGALP